MSEIINFVELLNNKNLTKNLLTSNLERLANNFPLSKSDCETAILTKVEKHLRPLFFESPCMKYGFDKPYGYAGDYYMMYLIHKNYPQGNDIGLLLDETFLSSLTCASVRERADIFFNNLSIEIKRKPVVKNVLIVGCGPCFELLNFTKNYPESCKITFTCLDIEQEAISFARQMLGVNPNGYNINYLATNVFKFQANDSYDFIYSAGLFDYLSDTLFRKLLIKLFSYLKTDGVLIIGNLSEKIPAIDNFAMEYIMDWKILKRNHLKLLSISSQINSNSIKTVNDSIGIGNYLIIRK